MSGGGRGVCREVGGGGGDVCYFGPSDFMKAYARILTLIIWIQLRHTQCMLVN